MTKQIGLLCTLAALLVVGSRAQSNGKKLVKSDNDLPRFVYPVKGSASALLEADDASFNAFSQKVGTDLDVILRDYDIADKGTLRTLLRTELDLQMLAGQYAAALDTVDRLRAEQEKPSAKLTTGIVEKAWLRAALDTKSVSGAPFEDSFSRQVAEAVNALPWDVVQDDIKQLYGGARIFTPAMALAAAKTDLDPAVQRSGALDNRQASDLIDNRAGLQADAREAIVLIRRGATTSEDGRRHLIDGKQSVALLQAQAKK